jgi:hypothetical protein
MCMNCICAYISDLIYQEQNPHKLFLSKLTQASSPRVIHELSRMLLAVQVLMQNCKAKEKQNNKGSQGSESNLYTDVLFELRDHHQRHWDLIRCACACVRACLHAERAHTTGPKSALERFSLSSSRGFCIPFSLSVFQAASIVRGRMLLFKQSQSLPSPRFPPHNHWKGLAQCTATATTAARARDAQLPASNVCANKMPASQRRRTIFIYSSSLASQPQRQR